jgi:8-oxo-dGTP pyrophosphatase MutT (NUDIX family)
MANFYQDLTPTEISRRLAHSHVLATDSPYPPGFLITPPRLAAVLIPLINHGNQWHVLFIRRAAGINDPHGGQVAFPGGAKDPDDADLRSTALRETFEEIGLRPDRVNILGQLRDFVTITNYQVTPFVGVIPWPYPIVLARDEVRRVFTIPLDWLSDPQNYEERARMLPPPFNSIRVIYFKPYDGETLWGASARFTTELTDLLSNDEPRGN